MRTWVLRNSFRLKKTFLPWSKVDLGGIARIIPPIYHNTTFSFLDGSGLRCSIGRSEFPYYQAMKKETAFDVLVVFVFAAVTFSLSPVLWHPADPAGPSATLLPFFIVLGVLEAILFGGGILFALKGWPLVRSVKGVPKWLAIAAYVSIFWQLISWWPHDNFHMSINHDDYQSLLYIEYVFHFTLYFTAAFVGMFFLKALTALRGGGDGGAN